MNLLSMVGLGYRNILKPGLFLIDAETVHEHMLEVGELLGNKISLQPRFYPRLRQRIAGIDFGTPVGLAAGFDYRAKLTGVLPSLGFGFETVGTITRGAYEGNPSPRLGRLPKSKSLLVNKGFKNEGASVIAERMRELSFKMPVGISIGRTNSLDLATQKQSVEDILQAFFIFEKSCVKNSYYELNISCPNLIHGNVSFYPQKNLAELLGKIDALKSKKPIFIKMPIELPEREILQMLTVISRHKIAGVIFGNLQKNKLNEEINQEEAGKFKMGYYSGRPTFKDSNRFIKLAYKNFGRKLVVIGCGGVFNADDAYLKIKLGASLVQMITGLVYEGPQVVAEINAGLDQRLKQDGFKKISEAVGSGA